MNRNTYSAYNAQRRVNADRVLRANETKRTDEKPVETFAEFKARKAAERAARGDNDETEGE